MSIEADIVVALDPLDPAPSSTAFCTPFGDADPTKRPRITYQVVSGAYNENLGGVGPYRGRRQIDIWALTYAQAYGLAAQARVALQAGLDVGSITDNPDSYEPDTKLHRISFDVAAWTK